MDQNIKELTEKVENQVKGGKHPAKAARHLVLSATASAALLLAMTCGRRALGD